MRSARGWRRCAAASAAARPTSRASCWRAPRWSAPRRPPPGRTRPRSAARSSAWPTRPRRMRASTCCWTAISGSSWPTSPPGPTSPGTTGSWKSWWIAARLRFAAWYELFPRSQGRVPGRHGTLRRLHRARSRTSPAWASTCSTCRPSTRSAAPPARARTTRSPPGPDDPGSPWAIGAPEGGHTAVHPELGTLEDFHHLVEAAQGTGPRDRARLRVPVLAGPSLGARASRVVPPPAGRHHQVRREPAQEVSGHLPDQLRDARTGQSLWDELLDVVLLLDRATACRSSGSTTRTPSRSGFWEWLIAEVQDAAPGRDLPLRGLHPAEGDARARQGRLHAVLHLLHLAQLQGGADRVPDRADPVGDGRVLPRQLLRQHARTFFPSCCSAAAARRSTCAPSWRPPSRSVYGIYSGFELCEARPCPAARSTWTPRSTRSGCATGTPPATSRTTSPGSTRSAARTRRSTRSATSASTSRAATTCSSTAR